MCFALLFDVKAFDIFGVKMTNVKFQADFLI